MYIDKEQSKQLLKEFAIDIDSELKEKSDFILSIANDDDWSMVIKSHALIETLVTELLVSITEEQKLKSVIERLPLSDEQIGKLKIAKDYGVISNHERRFIKRLSNLRNNLVHKFENIDFKFEDYVNGLDNGQKKAWKIAFTWYEQEKQVEKSWADATLSNSKTAVWLAIFMFVCTVVVKISELKANTKLQVAAHETTKKLLDENV